jgi:tRNA(Ile)-lysidine synthetase-like protein
MNARPARGASLDGRFERHVRQTRLLDGRRRVLAAVSGGSDSTALLHLAAAACRRRGVELGVVHVDHGLRGAASAADAAAVTAAAAGLGIECRVCSVRVAAGAGSFERAARAARLSCFAESARSAGAEAVLTGHTADDAAETLLLRLARGAGAAGLSGLRPERSLRLRCADGAIETLVLLRPLLPFGRAELREWLQSRRIAWQEDASNADLTIPRNRLRREILPWLERHGLPSLRRQLARSAAILRDEDAWLDQAALAAWAGGGAAGGMALAEAADSLVEGDLDAARLLALPPALARRVVRQWLLTAGCPEAGGFEGVERVLALAARRTAGGRVTLAGGVVVRRRGGGTRTPVLGMTFRVSGRSGAPVVGPGSSPDRAAGTAHGEQQRAPDNAFADPDVTVALPVPGVARFAGADVSASFAPGIVRHTDGVGVLPAACSLDPAVVARHGLALRCRRTGDRLAPTGLRGSRKLQDILVDGRVPVEERDRLPLLVSGDGQTLVWVPGYRVARAFAVRDPEAAAVQVRMWESEQ